MGYWRGLVTQVTLSPGGEGEPALNVYRILPFLPPQREGPLKPTEAEAFGLPRSPSYVDQEVGDYMGYRSSPWRAELERAAGVSLGGELLFKIRLCF